MAIYRGILIIIVAIILAMLETIYGWNTSYIPSIVVAIIGLLDIIFLRKEEKEPAQEKLNY